MQGAFSVLAIDFDNYTLAGYNVNTGDCMRPPGLSQKVYKDFDETLPDGDQLR